MCQEPFSDHLKVGNIHRNPVTQLQINNNLQIKEFLQVDPVQQVNQPPSSLLPSSAQIPADQQLCQERAQWDRLALPLGSTSPADHQDQLQLVSTKSSSKHPGQLRICLWHFTGLNKDKGDKLSVCAHWQHVLNRHGQQAGCKGRRKEKQQQVNLKCYFSLWSQNSAVHK